MVRLIIIKVVVVVLMWHHRREKPVLIWFVCCVYSCKCILQPIRTRHHHHTLHTPLVDTRHVSEKVLDVQQQQTSTGQVVDAVTDVQSGMCCLWICWEFVGV